MLTFLCLTSCDKKRKNYFKKQNSTVTEEKATEHAGKKLLRKKCFICHNPVLSESSMVAPPMIAVKAYYISEYTTKEQFTQNLLTFLKKPTKKNAKMLEAVKRFGLMSYQSFKEEDIKKIAEYLYDFKIKEPKWFKKYWEDKDNGKYININRK